jgi:hypothetical protein
VICPKCNNEMFNYTIKIEGRLCLIERCSECDFYQKNNNGNESDNSVEIKYRIKSDGVKNIQ